MTKRKDPDRVELEGVSATIMRDRGLDDKARPYWRARAKGGRRETLWTGWGTRAEVSAVVAELVRKGLTCSRPAGESAAVKTVGDLLRRWLLAQEEREQVADLAPKSLKNYRRAVAHWLAVAGDVAAPALSRAKVADQVVRWMAEGVSARSCRLTVDVLATAWKWGHDRELVPRLELSRLGVAVAREDEHVNCDYTPTRAEAAEVIAAIEPGRDQTLIRLLALTGARVGEIGALTVGSVDLQEGILVISGRDRTRGRRGKVAARRWPIVGELEMLLARLVEGRPREAPLIEDLPSNVSTIARRLLLEACEVAEVPRFTAHGLRRLVTMELLETADAKSVSLLTGHSVTVLLRDYVRPRAESLRDIVARSGVGSVRRKVIPLRTRAQRPGTTEEE